MKTVIGLDIGGTNVRMGLVRDGVLERGEAYATHETLTGGDEIALLGGMIHDFRGGEAVDAVSIGFPSSIGADGKTVLNPPNIVKGDGSRAFMGVNVADPLAQILGVKVLVNKDANHLLRFDAHSAASEARGAEAGAKGEAKEAGAKAAMAGTLVGCYIGTGFGSAVMVGGQFLRGKNGSAVETGHIPFFGGDRLCGCGKTGCAECYASGRAAKEILDSQYPGLTFDDMFARHSQDEPVAALIKAIAVTVAALVNIFDPHMLFLGGGVLSAAFPRDALTAAVLRHTMAPYPREGLDIRFSQHDSYSGVIGAALSAE